jgi:hypothetical protein
LYWLDVRQTSDTSGVVLRSINLPPDEPDITVTRNSKSLTDGYFGVTTGTLMSGVKHPVDGTDMVISKQSSDSLLLLLNANNTAVFADVGSEVKIIGGNIDEPLNATDTVSSTGVDAAIFSGYYRSKILLNTTFGEIPSLTPRYFTYDSHRKLIVWSDPGGEGIFIARYPYRIDEPLEKDPLRTRLIWVNPANAVSYPSSVNTSLIFPKLPVGIYLDKGSFSSTFEGTTECFGNGYCKGAEGNWECECYEGSVAGTSQGNCSPKTKDCPMGLAWFSKPVVDERAHDQVLRN